MATTSGSPFAYHVFLNFRGEDTRKTFTDHLYTALLQAGFQTFRDNESIERGKYLNLELPKAIKQSRISIVVLSKTYASSTWCLDELVTILECSQTHGNAVLPVFYDVEPSEVRKQVGSFGEAFLRYENEVEAEGDRERSLELATRVKGWKAALRQVADLTGMVLKNQADRHESKFIQKILKVIGEKLKRIALNVGPHLIDIDLRARNITSWLQDGLNDVGIVAICGMGGIGKTTIAKYLYNLNCERFEGSSFLASVREVSEQPDGLVRLQRQLLSDILKGKKEKIYNVDQGIVRIKEALCCRKVLVVLDDVDQVDQLDAVLGMRDWLCPGSKVIITTRQKQLLKASEVCKVHQVIEMDDIKSLELFSWYAFGQDHPNEGYMDYSKRVVYYSDGLPLALQVLGSSLSGKNIDVWESALEKLEAIPEGQILKKLKISYDSLQDDHDKNLYLDIACFFVGKDKDWTITILDGCGFFTKIGIHNLIDRCLLRVDQYDNKLMMHHLIQDMGREIVRQDSTDEPGKRSRLWHKEAFDVLREKTGTETVEGLILNMQKTKQSISVETPRRYHGDAFVDKSPLPIECNSSEQSHLGFLSCLPIDSVFVKLFSKSDQLELQTSALSRMHKLRLLQLKNIRLTGGYHEFPKKLRWLCWHGYPSRTIPTDFPLQNLVALYMRYSSLETVWKGTKPLRYLKMIDLSHSHGLVSGILDFSLVPYLKKLVLKHCINLIEVHESIGVLQRLVLLNLKGCQNLRKLPTNIHQLKSLEKLILSGCSKLYDEPFRFSFPSLPSSLVILNLANCHLSDSSLPKDFGGLGSLQALHLSGNPIHSLPGSIKGLTGLKKLYLRSCKKIQSLPELPTSLTTLDVDHCNSLHTMTNLPNMLTSLEFNAFECGKLTEVQHVYTLEPIGNFDAEMKNDLGLTNSESSGIPQVQLFNYLTVTSEKRPLQGLYEFGIFSTFLPGSEVPTWYGMKTKEPEISFTVPFTPNLKIRNFNVCVVFEYPYVLGDFKTLLYIKVTNKTDGRRWTYCPTFMCFPENAEDMMWLCHWNITNQIMKGGDEVRVSVNGTFLSKVKEFGVHVVYEQEENGTQKGTTNQTVIEGGDLSAYQIRTTGSYFLCHYNFFDQRRLANKERSTWESVLFEE